MTEHRGVLLERDTKTHRFRVVEVPASVLAELRTHVRFESAAIRTLWCSRHHSAIRCGCRAGGTGSGTPSQRTSASPDGRRRTYSVTRRRACWPRAACPCGSAASLGHDPAIFLRTYAHLYPGDLGAVADAMDAARAAVVDAQEDGKGSRVCGLRALWRAWISRGWPDAVARGRAWL